MTSIKFAVVADESGRSEGEQGYRLYYVAGDPEGRYILNSNAGVTCSNFSFRETFGDTEGGHEVGEEIQAVIGVDAGVLVCGEEDIPSEAADIMRQWGWLPCKTAYQVSYSGGESRTRPGKAVDYMLAEVDGVELYAEAIPADDDETATYAALKADIIAQAKAHGIDAKRLQF